jgi:pseudouridylate synthase
MNELIALSPEVAAALEEGAPVVALESTIITHGMPWPRNVETAAAVEAEIRAAGAVPATIAVIEGRIRVGLDARRSRAWAGPRG